MTSKYGTARAIISFISLIGWVGAVIGVAAVLYGLSLNSMATPMLLGAGLMTVVSSLILVAIGSVAVAVLDTADEAHKTTSLLRAIAEKQGVDVKAIAEKSTPPASTKAAQPQATTTHTKTAGGDVAYMGEKILMRANRWWWDGQDFLTLGKAKAAIKAAKSEMAET